MDLEVMEEEAAEVDLVETVEDSVETEGDLEVMEAEDPVEVVGLEVPDNVTQLLKGCVMVEVVQESAPASVQEVFVANAMLMEEDTLMVIVTNTHKEDHQDLHLASR